MFDLVRVFGDSAPIEYDYLLTDNEAAVMGEALVLTNGRLTKCGPTVTPEFVSVRAQAAEATSKTPLPVIRVTELFEFETTATATVATTLKGAKVTLHTDGAQVTATTTSGVFQINSTDGNTKVRGMFRR